MSDPRDEKIQLTPHRKNIKNMSNREIFDYFIELSEKKRLADEYMDVITHNKIFDILMTIRTELKSRPGDQRSILIPLIAHPSLQVRLNACMATLAVTPEALTMLRAIAALGWDPERGDALRMVHAIDDGRYVPT